MLFRSVELQPQLKSLLPTAEIIVITAHKISEIAVEVLKAGAWTYLNKPFFTESLLSAISSAITARYIKMILKELDKNIQETIIPFRDRLEMFKEYHLSNAKDPNHSISLEKMYYFCPEFKHTKKTNVEKIPAGLSTNDLLMWISQNFV